MRKGNLSAIYFLSIFLGFGCCVSISQADEEQAVSDDLTWYETGLYLTHNVLSLKTMRALKSEGLSPELLEDYYYTASVGYEDARSLHLFDISPAVASEYRGDGLHPVMIRKIIMNKKEPGYLQRMDLMKSHKGFNELDYCSKDLLVSSNIPYELFHETWVENISAQAAANFFILSGNTKLPVFSDQNTIDQYPVESLNFMSAEDIDKLDVSKKKINIPRDLFTKLYEGPNFLHFTAYSWSNDFMISDIKKMLSERNIKKPTVADLVLLSAEIVKDKMDYSIVDDLDHAEFAERNKRLWKGSYYGYWKEGVGDCDKFTNIYVIVFEYLKRIYPDVLNNVYVMRDRYFQTGSKEDVHSWNHLFILTKNQHGQDQMNIIPIDVRQYKYYFDHKGVLDYDREYEDRKNNQGDQSDERTVYLKKLVRLIRYAALDAMDKKRFNKKTFVNRYINYFSH